jgi:hypothetical protein
MVHGFNGETNLLKMGVYLEVFQECMPSKDPIEHNSLSLFLLGGLSKKKKWFEGLP